MENSKIINARFALETARQLFYKNNRDKKRKFTLTLKDFLPKN
jgi:hypothetical protein